MDTDAFDRLTKMLSTVEVAPGRDQAACCLRAQPLPRRGCRLGHAGEETQEEEENPGLQTQL